MEPEEKRILKETLELAKENNSMLKKIRRYMAWGRISRVVYWALIIGASLGAYYYIQPYVEAALETVSSIRSGAGAVSDGVTETTTAATGAMGSLLDIGKGFLGF